MSDREQAIATLTANLRKEKAEWTKADTDWSAVSAMVDCGYMVVDGGLCIGRREGSLCAVFAKAGTTGPVGAALFTRAGAENVAKEANRQTGVHGDWTVVFYRDYPRKRLAEVAAMAAEIGVSLDG